MRVSPEMQSAWSDYWKDGPTDSMPGDRAAGRLGALDAAWRAFFSALAPGSRILDLATGGGDVIRQAAATARDFAITGVDIADLSAVSAALAIPGLDLIGHTDLSSLPFADASFDGVASQFGFEYADTAPAAREAVRVLAPGGRGHFVIHHAHGAVTRGAETSLAAYRAVFDDSRAFALGRTAFTLRETAAPAAEIAEADAAFAAEVRLLQSRLRDDRAFGNAGNVVGFLTRLAGAPPPATEALHRLDVVEHHNAAQTLRKVAQIAAARDRAGMETIAANLTAAGAGVSAPLELKYPGGNLLGWSLSFQRQP